MGASYFFLGLLWVGLGVADPMPVAGHWRWLAGALGLLLSAYGVWRLRHCARRPQDARLRVAEVVGLFVAVLLFVRVGVVDSNRIASGSMLPNLLRGDVVLVNRLAYFCPRVAGFCVQPSRGDVIVYADQIDPRRLLVKRVLGLPGEHITYHDDRLVIDGRAFDYTPDVEVSFVSDRGEPILSPSFIEAIDDYRNHILEQPFPLHAKDAQWRVPTDAVFVLGDNRDYSNDSRFLGAVPRARIRGEVVAVLWSWDTARHRVRWQRLFRPVR